MNLMAAGLALLPPEPERGRLSLPPGPPPLWPPDWLLLFPPDAGTLRPAALAFVREVGEDEGGGWLAYDVMLELPPSVPAFDPEDLAARFGWRPEPAREPRLMPPAVFEWWCGAAGIRLPW